MSGHRALDAPRSFTSFWLPLGVAAMCSLIAMLMLVWLLVPPLAAASQMRVRAEVDAGMSIDTYRLALADLLLRISAALG